MTEREAAKARRKRPRGTVARTIGRAPLAFWIGDLPLNALPTGWLTIDQAAAHFGVSRATADRLIAAGLWPTSILPGMRHRRFSPENLAFIEQQAAQTARTA